MEFSGNMRVGDRIEHIIDDIARTEENLAVLEKLDGVGNETAFRHTENIIEWFESFLAVIRIERSLHTVFIVETRGG